MTGIAVVAGAPDADARLRRVLAAVPGTAPRREAVSIAPGLAVGKVFHGRLPHDRPPLVTADGLVVAVDGELYGDTAPLADAEATIAELYRRDSLDRIAHLNGSFAALVVDARRGRIVLATDRVGSRPLFAWHAGDALGACSRESALLADDRVPRRLSVQGLAELLTYQRTVADHTQYADIRVMAGSDVWVHADGHLDRRQTRRLAWGRPEGDKRATVERLVAALRRAAKRRLGDPVRHGLLLSGGLDSRLVLALARDLGQAISCATAATFDNAEVGIARLAAARAGASFRFMETAPDSIASQLDPATEACDGLFTAPINLFGLLPELAGAHDVLLSGHGLDYTFRGYYLPCVMVRAAGSVTRLPRLREIADGSPETVASALRVGIDRAALSGVLAPGVRNGWSARGVAAMATALSRADPASPYDSWDAFILHSLGRHYAYSDFWAMVTVVDHRTLTFDNEVFDTYLSMPPEWRAGGGVAHQAYRAILGDLADLPDANSGASARHHNWWHIAFLFARAALRRAGLAARPPAPPAPTMTHGSWANYGELLRRAPALAGRLEALPGNAALMDTGLFAAEGMRRVVEEHRAGRAKHSKLLMQLLTLASWLGRHGYSQVIHDG